MFSGIVQATAIILACTNGPDSSLDFFVARPPSENFQKCVAGDSISVNGTCLTIVEISPSLDAFHFYCSPETIEKTAGFTLGASVNLEPALALGDPLGGHLVTGHIDVIGEVIEYTPVQSSGSWYLRIRIPEHFSSFLAPKGSISIDGVSMTINGSYSDSFDVNVIPYTYEHTNFKSYKVGTFVNLEVDLVSRYLCHWLQSHFKESEQVSFG